MVEVLSLVTELVASGSFEDYGQLYYLSAPGDYEIISARAVPDSTAVTSGTLSIFIGKLLGGSDTTSQRALKLYASAVPTLAEIGAVLEGWIQDPNDPSAQGFRTVQLLNIAPIEVNFFQREDRPIVKRGELIVFLLLNTTNSNHGTVVCQLLARKLATAPV